MGYYTFCAEAGHRLIAIEIKASTRITDQDIDNLHWFATEGPGRSRRVRTAIFYLGSEILSLGAGIVALPISVMWAF